MINDKKINSLEVVSLISAVALVGVVEWLGVIQPVKDMLAWVYSRPTTAMTKIIDVAASPLAAIPQSYRAARRLQELQLEYSQALAEISELKAVQKENELLRQILQTEARPDNAVIAAPVNSYGQPSITAGAEDNLVSGQPVLVAGNLVGLVGEVRARQSLVTLLPQLKETSILAKTESGLEGLVIGNGRQILLTELPNATELKVGETVVTAGQSLIQPDIFIGKIQHIQEDPTAPVLTAVIEPAASFFQAPIVEVLP